MQKIIIAGLITIIFFSIRGAISLIIIIWGSKKVKNFLEKRKKQKLHENEAEI